MATIAILARILRTISVIICRVTLIDSDLYSLSRKLDPGQSVVSRVMTGGNTAKCNCQIDSVVQMRC